MRPGAHGLRVGWGGVESAISSVRPSASSHHSPHKVLGLVQQFWNQRSREGGREGEERALSWHCHKFLPDTLAPQQDQKGRNSGEKPAVQLSVTPYPPRELFFFPPICKKVHNCLHPSLYLKTRTLYFWDILLKTVQLSTSKTENNGKERREHRQKVG